MDKDTSEHQFTIKEDPLELILKTHDDQLKFGLRGMCWIPEKELIIVANYSGIIKSFSSQNLKRVYTYRIAESGDFARQIAYSRKFSILVVNLSTSKLGFFRVSNDGQLKMLKMISTVDEDKKSLLIIDDLNLLIVTSSNSTQIWSIPGMKHLKQIHWTYKSNGADMIYIKKLGILGISFSSNSIHFINLSTFEVQFKININIWQKILLTLRYDERRELLLVGVAAFIQCWKLDANGGVELRKIKLGQWKENVCNIELIPQSTETVYLAALEKKCFKCYSGYSQKLESPIPEVYFISYYGLKKKLVVANRNGDIGILKYHSG